MRFAAFLLVTALSACALFGPSKEEHPRDVETKGTACEADDAPTLAPSARPASGSLIAFEGVPQAQLICTQLGCAFECCDNTCGFDADCPYVLRDANDPKGEVCLAHAAFACGGSDCSPFCEPFSHAPKQRYRFVGRVEYRDASRGQTPILRVEKFCQSP